MATLLNGDIYVVRYYCTLADQLAINRVFHRISNVVGVPTDLQLAQGYDSNFAAIYKGILVIDASYRGVGVQRVRPAPTTVEVYGTAGQGNGTAATPPLPKQISGLSTFRTDFAGRRYRGRIYWPFPSEADNDGVFGRPTAGYLVRTAGIMNSMDQPLAIVNGGDSFTATPVLFNAVSGATVDITGSTNRPYWATQRRRGDFGPKNVSPI